MKLAKRSNKQNVLCDSNKNSDASNFMTAAFLKKSKR